jgi:hypothetical protein
MTQFMLCAGPRPDFDPSLGVNVRDPEVTPNVEMARRYFGFGGEVCDLWTVVDVHEEMTDTLFTEAQHRLADGAPMEDTRLSAVLRELGEANASCVLWWASAWDDLVAIVDDCAKLISEVERQLRIGPGEVYIAYNLDSWLGRNSR